MIIKNDVIKLLHDKRMQIENIFIMQIVSDFNTAAIDHFWNVFEDFYREMILIELGFDINHLNYDEFSTKSELPAFLRNHDITGVLIQFVAPALNGDRFAYGLSIDEAIERAILMNNEAIEVEI